MISLKILFLEKKESQDNQLNFSTPAISPMSMERAQVSVFLKVLLKVQRYIVSIILSSPYKKFEQNKKIPN